jgi:O-antigen/teichoic acid export membrane protein
MKVIYRLKQFVNNRSERSQVVIKNAFGAILVKVFAMIVDFAKVPLLLSYLDSEKYGLYVTIASVVYWTHNFDFGLGTGLRYKLTLAVSLGEEKYGRQLVSTAYLSMSGIMMTVLAILIPVCLYLDWNTLLNTNAVDCQELAFCVITVLVIFVFQFILELITYVLQAFQRAALSTFFKPLANFFTLIVVVVLKLFTDNSLLYACMAMTIPIAVILLICNFYLYIKTYHRYSPSYKFYQKKCLSDIYSLGLKFFVGQLSTLVVFQTASFLIAHYVNPVEAAVYNSAFTYFGLILIFNGMAQTPLCAAITDAYVKGDYIWLNKSMKKMKYLSLAFSVAAIAMLAVSPIFFQIWLNGKLSIPFALSCILVVYFILNIWSNPYLNFISGMGKMQATMYLSLIKIVVFFPVAISLVKMFGTIGLVVSIITVNTLPNLILGKYQTNLLLNKKESGVWSK